VFVVGGKDKDLELGLAEAQDVYHLETVATGYVDVQHEQVKGTLFDEAKRVVEGSCLGDRHFIEHFFDQGDGPVSDYCVIVGH
jgi:hypothetical protein